MSVLALKEQYAELRSDGALAPAAALYRLERAAWICAETLAGERRLVAFVLASLFDRLANRLEGDAVEAEYAEGLFRALDQQIVGCIDVLAHPIPGDAATVCAQRAIDALFQADL